MTINYQIVSGWFFRFCFNRFCRGHGHCWSLFDHKKLPSATIPRHNFWGNSDPLVAGFTPNFPVVSPSPSCRVGLHWLIQAEDVDQRPPEANELSSDSSDSGGPEKNGSWVLVGWAAMGPWQSPILPAGGATEEFRHMSWENGRGS